MISIGDAADGSETAISDSAGNAFFFTGDSTSINVAYAVNFQLAQISDTQFGIIMSNSVEVAGLQFSISDDPDYYSFVSVANGSVLTGFQTSGSDQDGDFTLLSFNLSGGSVAPGFFSDAMVITMENNDDAPETFETELCFEDIVLSDPLAQPIAAGSQCATFTYPCVDCEPLSNEEMIMPEEFSIGYAYPNPFNPSTTIEWGMHISSDHRLEVYNTNGQLLDIVSQGYITPGFYKATWDASDHSSGVYVMRLVVGDILVGSRKIMLVK